MSRADVLLTDFLTTNLTDPNSSRGSDPWVYPAYPDWGEIDTFPVVSVEALRPHTKGTGGSLDMWGSVTIDIVITTRRGVLVDSKQNQWLVDSLSSHILTKLRTLWKTSLTTVGLHNYELIDDTGMGFDPVENTFSRRITVKFDGFNLNE